jgi:hypothetical protein
MRGTIVRIGATGACALLALGLLAGPSAGATGSDNQNKAERRAKVTCFDAASADHTQGRSLSDPDGMSNGGADKPGPDCTGGVNKDDRDGNNGCGNDADREDDNNGNCGHQKTEAGNTADEQASGNDATVKPEKVDADVTVQAAGSAQAAGVPAAEASTTTTTAPTTVLGSAATAPAGTEATTTTTTPGTQVLGETLSRPGTLARTGAGIGGLALLGGLLCGGGRLTVLARKLLRIG